MADEAVGLPRRVTLHPSYRGSTEVVTSFDQWPQPLGTPGHLEHVEVIIEGTRFVTEASVMEVDHQRKLAYLNVYWHALHEEA